MSKTPLLLCILDGYGDAAATPGNAIAAAHTPNMDRLKAQNPHTLIHTSGMEVGLPEGQMGNSEVGHANLGAGRVLYQDYTRITKSIADGDFFENPALCGAVQNALENNTALHLVGLLSDGGVHSHNSHVWALLRLAKKAGLSRVYVHALLDGRDVPPASGADFLAECQEKMQEIGVGTIASVMGRFYAMDRDNIWERVEQAYATMVYGEGLRSDDPVAAVRASYESVDADGKNITDEFVVPTICCDGGRIAANDSVIFFNFRPDRAREITRPFVDPDFAGFARKNGFFPLYYVCMTQYDATMPNVQVAYLPQSLKNTMGEYLSALGKTQLRIAETQKYAHVTYFFNGGAETVFPGEDRILIDSPKISTFDLKPEMSAYEVTDAVLKEIEAEKYDVIVLNFANCDMVGHTGIFAAAKAAVEAVDACLGRVTDAIAAKGGISIITADHGNAEKMLEPDGSPFTAHTTTPVPFVVVGKDCQLREGGKLADIAPTMLKLMGIPQPAEMSGESIVL